MVLDRTRQDGEPVHVLLVEDNPGDVRLVQEAFGTSDVETTIHTVSDGTDALEFLSDRQSDESARLPDLVLLDLNLGRMNGFEVLEEIRDEPELSRLPVVVLTSSKVREDVVKSYELSANAYLTKADSLDDFISLVEAIEEFWIETARLPPVPP